MLDLPRDEKTYHDLVNIHTKPRTQSRSFGAQGNQSYRFDKYSVDVEHTDVPVLMVKQRAKKQIDAEWEKSRINRPQLMDLLVELFNNQ